MNVSLKRRVWRRARGACEYCRMPSRFYRAPFQIDHIIAKQHGGVTEPKNLCLACYHYNLNKGPNIAGKDPASGRTTRLFNPRVDAWEAHFLRDGPRMVGRTAVGRTTVQLLDMNHPAYVLVREALIRVRLFE
jgi:hypothetical protein